MKEHGEKEAHNTWRKEHYNTADTNDKLIINLRDLSHTMRFLYEGRGSQKRILMVLAKIDGSITQQKLTERLGIQPGSASEVIAKLESAGYITRTPNETDRRTSDILLTEAGKAAAAEARQQRNQRHEQMFSCLSGSEKAELLSLLERINTDWQERYHDIGAPQGPCKMQHGPCGHCHGEDHHGKDHHGKDRHGDDGHEKERHGSHGKNGCKEPHHREKHHGDDGHMEANHEKIHHQEEE